MHTRPTIPLSAASPQSRRVPAAVSPASPRRRRLAGALALGLCAVLCPSAARSEEMDKMWGESVVKLRAEDAKRGQLFSEGNYAMFIHWGLYSPLGNEVNGKTHYGIGEWIMNKAMAGQFNPVKFDAKAVARLARDAGMKYIITSKHHDGFAMFGSKADPFNIVDATPWQRDPMKDLGPPEVDRTFGIDPSITTELDAHFATASGAKLNSRRWMEKFGEWKHAMEVTTWEAGGLVVSSGLHESVQSSAIKATDKIASRTQQATNEPRRK